MKSKNPAFRRKREHKTNYKRRLTLLKGRQTRLVVRGFTNSILGQFVDYEREGDKVIVGVNSLALKGQGWKHSCGNLPAAYLTGLVLGKLGKKKGVRRAILDMGFHPSIRGCRVFCFTKGVIDGGIDVPIKDEMLPSEDRTSGGPKVKKDFEKLKEKLK